MARSRCGGRPRPREAPGRPLCHMRRIGGGREEHHRLGHGHDRAAGPPGSRQPIRCGRSRRSLYPRPRRRAHTHPDHPRAEGPPASSNVAIPRDRRRRRRVARRLDRRLRWFGIASGLTARYRVGSLRWIGRYRRGHVETFRLESRRCPGGVRGTGGASDRRPGVVAGRCHRRGPRRTCWGPLRCWDMDVLGRAAVAVRGRARSPHAGRAAGDHRGRERRSHPGSGLELRCKRFDAMGWRSTDGGRSWSAVGSPSWALPGDQVVRDVTVSNHSFVAVGYDASTGESQGAAWSSSDGLRWRRMQDEDLGGVGALALDSVVAAPAGVVATRSTTERGDVDAAFWLLRRGDWTRTNDAPLAAPGDQTAFSIAAGSGSVLVAVGYDDAARSDGAAVWRSVDGRTWDRIRRRPSPPARERSGC